MSQAPTESRRRYRRHRRWRWFADLPAGRGDWDLYTEGDELYDAMVEAIGSARRSVCLESYIFASDEVGWRVAEALAEAARRGCRVRLLIDAVGSFARVSRHLLRHLRSTGVQTRRFHRWSWRRPFRYNRRNHRKLLVVDDRLAFLGGFNIHRENSRAIFGEARWRDTHLGASGELAAELARQFDAVWTGRLQLAYTRQVARCAVVVSNIFRNFRRRFGHLHADMLRAARRCACLTTPYFVPDYRTQKAMLDAAGRGVTVNLLVPYKSDVPIVRWAARALYARLLGAGVRIFEYQPRVLHAKTAVFDDEWCVIGSANIDYRSFFLNYELNLVAHDVELARRLADQFRLDLREAKEVHPAQWRRRPWAERLEELIGRLVRKWL